MPLSQPSARRGGLYRRGREMARARGASRPARLSLCSFESSPGVTRQSIDVDPRDKPAGDAEGKPIGPSRLGAQLCAMIVPLSGLTITVSLWPFFVTVAEKFAPSRLKLLKEA